MGSNRGISSQRPFEIGYEAAKWGFPSRKIDRMIPFDYVHNVHIYIYIFIYIDKIIYIFI